MNTSGKTIANVFQRKIDDLNMGQELLVFSGIEEATKSVAQTKSFVLILGDFQRFSWTYHIYHSKPFYF